VWKDVGVHLKGNYGTFQGVDGKPSLTLNFDKFVRNQKFHGLDKFHLNNSVSDPSYMTELLCRELFLTAGVPTARVTHARLEINGRDVPCLQRSVMLRRAVVSVSRRLQRRRFAAFRSRLLSVSTTRLLCRRLRP
jgi:hypothetical protein